MRNVTVVERTVIMLHLTVIKRPAWSDSSGGIADCHSSIFKSNIELN